jgi:[ribosomal protein S5]-alanine N-acetyltransferase
VTPKLKTGRLNLYGYTAGMVQPHHIAWLNDPRTVRYSEQRHRTHTLESQHKYLNEFPVDSHIWLIEAPLLLDVLPNNTDIGTIAAYIDRANKTADVGILIGEKSCWRKDYGFEAWNAVVRFLLTNGTRKIECGCMKSNMAMRKLAEKNYMVLEGVRHDHFLLDGKPEDMLMYRSFS